MGSTLHFISYFYDHTPHSGLTSLFKQAVKFKYGIKVVAYNTNLSTSLQPKVISSCALIYCIWIPWPFNLVGQCNCCFDQDDNVLCNDLERPLSIMSWSWIKSGWATQRLSKLVPFSIYHFFSNILIHHTGSAKQNQLCI